MQRRALVVAALGVAIAAALAAAVLVAVGGRGDAMAIDPGDASQVARGRDVYARHCGSCHGMNLEGQPNWRDRLPSGRLPAPPHDASGHTWHHPDSVLFGIVKEGLVPGKYAPPGYQSDMPGFAGTLSDADIRASLAYIKSAWPERERASQREIDRRYRAQQAAR